MRLRSRPILWLATILHLVWGSLLVTLPSQVNSTTGLAPFREYPEIFGLVMFTSALAAIAALAYEATGHSVNRLSFWALIPQQTLLMVSAFSVIFYIIHGRYADGTVVPNGALHIFTDQLAYILLAVLHPFGVIRMHLPIMPVKK